jgi:hypothetical protein
VTRLTAAFASSGLPLAARLTQFPRHVRRQDVARFLVKYELFKLAAQSYGSIVECGVYAGAGLLTWHHVSAILEPYAHTRRIIGFDTFDGFPEIDPADAATGTSEHLHAGGFRTFASMRDEIAALCEIHDSNRPLGHIPKVELVQGDAVKTIPEYLHANPHLLISLIYLDFDIYKPTKAALEHLYRRVVKGGIVAFDELNCKEFPGETVALLETIGVDNAKIKRFAMDPYISYFCKGD